MVKLSDYVFRTLADWGVRHVFMLTGGGAMHLNESLAREQRIHYICNHHEQASAMAAEAYARVLGTPGVINVTTGPGGINALNGVFGAWTDSIPMLVVSGQVKRETCLASYGLSSLRQLGDQEADIIGMVRGITKYARLVDDPNSIRYHLERAFHLAGSGSPGPCWLDIPVDVQSAKVDEKSLSAYDPREDDPHWDRERLRVQCAEIIERLEASPRPVLMIGGGIRLAHAEDVFWQVARKLGIPLTTGFSAHDMCPSDDPLFCGRPGTIGDRPGNFTVQNAETLLVVGCRLNIRQVSYNWKSFARCAYKIQVDADAAELQKPTVRPDLPVHCDARLFLEELCRQLEARDYQPGKHDGWLAWCRERVARYPAVRPAWRLSDGTINPYHFVDCVFERLDPDDTIVCSNAAACIVPFQAGKIKRGQRMFSNSGSASMGYDLPAAVGAAIARGGKRVVCFAGDGSVQLNIQEFQTIAHHRLPIKVFVLNNGGYLSIRTTQKNFFGHLAGESPASGVSFPDVVKVAEAYGLPAVRIDRPDFGATLDQVLSNPGPIVCEVMLDPDQQFEPRSSSRVLPDGRIVSAPLEDMFPFLERDELKQNMLIPLLEP